MRLFDAWLYVSHKEAGNIDHDSSGASQTGKYLSDQADVSKRRHCSLSTWHWHWH
jgi:hypothetical protein